MSDPTIVHAGSLEGRRVALSASESADLPRLGLSEFHCRLAVAEIGRALMIAGATVVYGGNLDGTSYTDILIDEAQRFAGRRGVLEVVLAESEYGPRSRRDLIDARARIGEIGKLLLVGVDATIQHIHEHQEKEGESIDAPAALTAMRRYVSDNTDARVLVGGRLEGFQGSEPGVIEEARFSLHAGSTLLVAGGFGGAAAAVADALGAYRQEDWTPSDFPLGADSPDVQSALARLVESGSLPEDDAPKQTGPRRTLAVSHRPADIASSVVQLLARA